MIRTTGNGSKDLGRRAFGTAEGWKTSDETPTRSGEVIDPAEEIPCKSIVQPVSGVRKPRAGRNYNYPVRRIVEEK